MSDEEDWEKNSIEKEAGDDDWETKEDDESDDWEKVPSKDVTTETTPKSASQDVATPKSVSSPTKDTTGQDVATPKSVSSPTKGTTAGSKVERLLPEGTSSGQSKTINSFIEFEVKTFNDVEVLINQFIKPKLYPADPSTLTAKKAHAKAINMAVDSKAGLMELKEMEKFQAEIAKLIKTKKAEALEAEKEAKKQEALEDQKRKEELEEAKRKEAEEKGETYVNDEDFFAGLE